MDKHGRKNQQTFDTMSFSQKYKISYKETASPEEVQILRDGIIAEAFKAKGMGKIVPFSFFVRDSEERIIAGIQGSTFYGCLYTNLLWVAPQVRKQGLGALLLHKAEDLGRERNCSFATLTTMDWEALIFYQKLGYEIEYVREGFEKNSKMFLLRKSL